MTLKQAITERMGKNVKIGSFNSFVYCGVVFPELANLLDHLARVEHNRYKNLKLSAVNNLKNLQNTVITQEDADAKTEELRKMDIDIQITVEDLERERWNRMESLENTIAGYNEKISFRPIIWTSRNVKEIYQSIEDPDIDIIIYKGFTDGSYWSQDEMEKDYKMQKLIRRAKAGEYLG